LGAERRFLGEPGRFGWRELDENRFVEVVLVVILAASAVVAFGIARLWAVVIPIAAIGAFYVGLNAGWWGNGVGDGWQFVMAGVMAVGVLAAAIGLGARALLTRA
jgi:hypothetical protein